MARQINSRPLRKALYLFWEGESEEAYAKFLREKFSTVADIRIHPDSGLFHCAKAAFRGNVKLKNAREEIDEIWFFFDTEPEMAGNWDSYYKVICALRKRGRKREPIRIRLLMTTACVEYFFLLHFEKTRPAILTVADKAHIARRLQSFVPAYRKGDFLSTEQIGAQYPVVLENGEWAMQELLESELPQKMGIDARDRWLFTCGKTFTTVHEAVGFLSDLRMR